RKRSEHILADLKPFVRLGMHCDTHLLLRQLNGSVCPVDGELSLGHKRLRLQDVCLSHPTGSQVVPKPLELRSGLLERLLHNYPLQPCSHPIVIGEFSLSSRGNTSSSFLDFGSPTRSL